MSDNSAILLVDDESPALDLGTRLLKQLGFQDIDVASSGAVALEKARAKTYQVIISDWNMPEMTGIELLWRIRQDPALKATPFLITSVDGDMTRVALARELRVSAFLLKPYDSATLKSKLLEVVAGLPELSSATAAQGPSELPRSSYLLVAEQQRRAPAAK
jgi:two-component system chemotaxis response regulator CheY